MTEEQRSTRARVVTTPDEIAPSAGDRYVQRRNRFYSARAKRQNDTRLTPRTYAQTGVPAASGQARSVKRLPQYHPSPIPVRSGRRGRGRNVLMRLFALFALLLALGLATNFALTGSTFRIAEVSVVGTQNAPLAQAIQHMGVQGQNIFLIDVAALTARIDRLPPVAAVSLRKQWPDRLQVVISERVPLLLWQSGNTAFSVDRDGVVIAPAAGTSAAAVLRTVVDQSRRAPAARLRPGARLPAADIDFALTVFDQLPRVTSISGFSLAYSPAEGGDGSFVVTSRAGWLAYLGGAGDANPLDNRLIELQRILLLAQQQQLKLATVDLRYGLRPVYTVK
jgi:POTRA domain, FtsQ-type